MSMSRFDEWTDWVLKGYCRSYNGFSLNRNSLNLFEDTVYQYKKSESILAKPNATIFEKQRLESVKHSIRLVFINTGSKYLKFTPHETSYVRPENQLTNSFKFNLQFLKIDLANTSFDTNEIYSYYAHNTNGFNQNIYAMPRMRDENTLVFNKCMQHPIRFESIYRSFNRISIRYGKIDAPKFKLESDNIFIIANLLFLQNYQLVEYLESLGLTVKEEDLDSSAAMCIVNGSRVAFITKDCNRDNHPTVDHVISLNAACDGSTITCASLQDVAQVIYKLSRSIFK